MTNIRMANPTKHLAKIKLKVPEPILVQGINDRYLHEAQFGEHEELFYCNPHTFELYKWLKIASFNDRCTGGSKTLFSTKEDAIKWAYNFQLDKAARELETKKAKFKTRMLTAKSA